MLAFVNVHDFIDLFEHQWLWCWVLMMRMGLNSSNVIQQDISLDIRCVEFCNGFRKKI